jgi:restriction endonuclease Mrr
VPPVPKAKPRFKCGTTIFVVAEFRLDSGRRCRSLSALKADIMRGVLYLSRKLQKRVVLIDGSRLSELLVEFGVGIRVSRVVGVKRLDEDFFADE